MKSVINHCRHRVTANRIIVSRIMAFASLLLLAGIITVPSDVSAHQMADYTGMVFPPDHALNMPIDSLPVHPNSDNYIASIGRTTSLHPDFGTSWNDGGKDYQMGIPYNIVGAGQPLVPISFDYDDESDPGPWPIPQNPFIETVFDWREQDEGDRHLLIVDSSAGVLYEAWNSWGNESGTSWEAGSGAKFDLKGYTLRPDEWTSADAAGLPIFPLLIRYDEVERALAEEGEVHHAIRFTASGTQKAYVWPARHLASSSTDKNRPPMGLRFRMKTEVDISGYSPRMQVILRTMKKYGLIMSDNGGNWFFQGTHDDRWDDEEINTLKKLRGSDFEAVDISPWTSRPGFDPNSGKVPPAPGATTAKPRGIHFENGCEVRRNRSGNSAASITVSFYQIQGGHTTIRVYDAYGRVAATLIDAIISSGRQTIGWNGRNRAGKMIGQGTFIVQLRQPGGEMTAVPVPMVR